MTIVIYCTGYSISRVKGKVKSALYISRTNSFKKQLPQYTRSVSAFSNKVLDLGGAKTCSLLGSTYTVYHWFSFKPEGGDTALNWQKTKSILCSKHLGIKLLSPQNLLSTDFQHRCRAIIKTVHSKCISKLSIAIYSLVYLSILCDVESYVYM